LAEEIEGEGAVPEEPYPRSPVATPTLTGSTSQALAVYNNPTTTPLAPCGRGAGGEGRPSVHGS